MAKTYTSVPNVATGDVYTASTYNTMTAQNINNLRVPPMCTVYLDSNTTSYVSDANISWKAQYADTEEPSDNMWTVGDPTKIYAQTAGHYLVTFSGWLQATSGTFASGDTARITRNDTLQFLAPVVLISASAQAYWSVSTIVRCTAGQWITARVGHSATTATISGGATENHQQTRLSVAWLGQVS